MLRGTDLRVHYGRTPALAGVSWTAHPGRVLGLIGPNGSGKSTLLRAVLRAVDSAGKLWIDTDDLRRLSTRELARRTAVVAQQEEGVPEITVAELVLLGRSVHRSDWASYTDEDRAIAGEAMTRTGVTQLADRTLGQLSGGERQRVLIARALAQRSRYLLLDEPTNHLDVHYQHEVLTLVRHLGLTSVVVLHDLNLAARYCDDLVLLHDGRVRADGRVDDVLTPEILEPVYGVRVTPIRVDGVLQLVLAPRSRADRSSPPT
ncbi:ABC transporter ATP-binding protein [Micropruina sp.]|uniref:ABC transporter ATP-binding protein n=1 Tax=Micropruina sp. TaxID=2737536 RepID=UPI0039E416A8